MLKILKNEQGFTLMETIISIAALAIVSGFILQMFLVASHVNDKASQVDTSNNLVFNTIEIFKKQESADIYINNPIFENCGTFQNGARTTIYKGFDKAFNQIGTADFDPERVSPDICFLLKVEIERGLAAESSSSGAENPGHLDQITATVLSYVNPDKVEELVRVSADKYFVN